MQFISPVEVNSKILQGEKLSILDVREEYEHTICNINAMHIPMGELVNRIAEISKEEIVIVMCKTGKRAEAVANFLEADYGFEKMYVLEGGIISWIEQVDTNLELY